MKEIEKYHTLIEREIRKQTFGKSPLSLYEPIRYLMGLGGKRLRPLLTLLGYSLYANDISKVAKQAVALEVFHNFTLMHDDIMDQAPLRRGHATVHKKWNVNTAILSGDVMLVHVYSMLGDLDPDLFKTVVKRLNKVAIEVCEGQQWDMEYEQSAVVSEKEYLNMIRLKTAVLLGFSLELGALLAGAPEADQKILRYFGTNMGIGFQLKDDLLDAYADPKKFGKQIGGDIIANKKTYLLIKALENGSLQLKKELQKWLTVKRFKKKEKVAAIKNIYDQTQIEILTKKKMDSFFKKGFKELEKLDVNPEPKRILRDFSLALAEREW